MKLMALLIGLW